MSKKIIFKVSALGNPTIDAEGYEGDECHKATEGFEKVFSGAEVNVVEKPEAMLQAEEEQHETDSFGM